MVQGFDVFQKKKRTIFLLNPKGVDPMFYNGITIYSIKKEKKKNNLHEIPLYGFGSRGYIYIYIVLFSSYNQVKCKKLNRFDTSI